MENGVHISNELVDTSLRIHDAVHGFVEYPSFVRDIIDTLEFQRLRSLKQLGVTTKVFINASHTRFEHCLGVCYLADKLLSTLETNSGVQVSDIHRKCVMLAGLLHDLGHGPYSHMWETFVHGASDKGWTHEQSSCELACLLFENNNIKLSQEAYEHFYGEQLICALITGNEQALKTLLTADTMYLAEIVHNKWYKIDVDKWDYLLRDIYYLKGTIDIRTDFTRLFDHACVLRDADGVTHIGYREKDYQCIVDLFAARAKLHIECYQHPTTLGIERMLMDAFIQAENCGFRFKGVKISEAHLSPTVYMYLDDSIVNFIEANESSSLQGAQKLLTRIRQRKLYRPIMISSQSFDIEILNKRFGEDQFFEVHKKIPYACNMAPLDILLYDEQNMVVDNRKEVDRTLASISEQGFYEQYIVYCKSGDSKIINCARQYLEHRFH